MKQCWIKFIWKNPKNPPVKVEQNDAILTALLCISTHTLCGNSSFFSRCPCPCLKHKSSANNEQKFLCIYRNLTILIRPRADRKRDGVLPVEVVAIGGRGRSPGRYDINADYSQYSVANAWQKISAGLTINSAPWKTTFTEIIYNFFYQNKIIFKPLWVSKYCE